jgi:hypothetical protein
MNFNAGPYTLNLTNGRLKCKLSDETKKMIEDDKREEHRIENLEYEEECRENRTDTEQGYHDSGTCEADFC